MTRLSAALYALVLLAACAEPAEPLARMSDRLAAALAAPDRSAAERLRDETRETAEIAELSQVEPGDRVLDVGGGSGYMSRIFSTLVGPEGHVDLHNSPGWVDQLPGLEESALAARAGRENVSVTVAPFDDTPGADASYDVIIMALVYHDVPLEPVDRFSMNENFRRLLKPGARLVISDHDAEDGAGAGHAASRHRIEKAMVIAEVEAAGFTLVEEIDIDTSDNRRISVFNPAIRGRTDRFVLAFEPEPTSP